MSLSLICAKAIINSLDTATLRLFNRDFAAERSEWNLIRSSKFALRNYNIAERT